MKKVVLALMLMTVLVFALGCGGGGDKPQEETIGENIVSPEQVLNDCIEGTFPAWDKVPLEELDEGLEYIDLKVGGGETILSGQTALVHYTGWLKNGKKFDSSRDRDATFNFPLGQGRVIKGWDMGVDGMAIGGHRLLVIPSSLGYGARGSGGVIPPDAALIFAVELVGIQ